MLPTQIALEDIDCVESFVANAIERSGLRAHIADSEHETLIAEGITILYELHSKYEPYRPGYATHGRFSGFAAQFLPRRLGDAWHAMHPEHRRMAGEDGKRRWHYHEAPISLDQLLGTPAVISNGNRAVEGRDDERHVLPPEKWVPLQPGMDSVATMRIHPAPITAE